MSKVDLLHEICKFEINTFIYLLFSPFILFLFKFLKHTILFICMLIVFYARFAEFPGCLYV